MSRPLLRAIPTACLLVIISMAMPASSNHMQMDSGRVIVFDHVGGNEWWVEAQLAGQDGGQVATLWVAQYPASSHMWVQMTWNAEWGKWTASTHILPGSPVKFRALWDGGAMQSSCWFSHPAGEEACGGTGNPTPLEATFTMVKGNEWWVQTQVTPNDGHVIDHVEVRVGEGEWRSLQRQSWGVRDYAASYHISEGSIVQFRAADTQTLSDLSDCYRWIPAQGQDASAMSCSSTTFDAQFSGVRGNDWWVEAVVAANAPVNAVLITFDCQGTQGQMVYRADWGKWVLSGVHIPPGTSLMFTAHGDAGFESSGNYIWPQATPGQAC